MSFEWGEILPTEFEIYHIFRTQHFQKLYTVSYSYYRKNLNDTEVQNHWLCKQFNWNHSNIFPQVRTSRQLICTRELDTNSLSKCMKKTVHFCCHSKLRKNIECSLVFHAALMKKQTRKDWNQKTIHNWSDETEVIAETFGENNLEKWKGEKN